MQIRNEAKKIIAAASIALGAVALVVAFVAWQEPSAQPVPLRAPKPTAALTPPEPKRPTPPKEQTSARKAPEVPPKPAKEPSPPEPAPKKAAAEKTARKKVKPARVARKVPQVKPKKAAPRQPPRPKMVSTTAPHGMGFKVKFKSIDAFESLVNGGHVSVILEYSDEQRFLLPQDLDGELVTFEVPEDRFRAMVSENRVSELEPTPELMDRLEVHARHVRYLAVLSDDIRSAIVREAERARVNASRSVMVIDADRGQPDISVLLARR